MKYMKRAIKQTVLIILSIATVIFLSVHPVYMGNSSKSSGEDYKASSDTWGVADGVEDSNVVNYISSLLKKWSWPVFVIAFLYNWFGNEKKRPIAKRICIVSSISFVIGFAMTLYVGTMDGFRMFFKREPGKGIIEMIGEFIDFIFR